MNKALIPCVVMGVVLFFGSAAFGLRTEASILLSFLVPPALYLVGALGMDRLKERRQRMRLPAFRM